MTDLKPLPDDFTSLVDDKGVLKKITKKGHTNMSPIKGETVVVHFVGTYEGGDRHGEKFDSTRDTNNPLKYPSEEGHVIKAWDIVIPTMKLGEVCEIIVAPEYSYFDENIRRYEIELLDFYGKDVSPKYDGTVCLTRLVEGNGAISPRSGFLCELHIRGYCSGRLFEERDVSFLAGDFVHVGIPEGLSRAVCYMNEGEEGRVRICEPMTFSIHDSEKRGIPKGSILYYVVKVKSCEQRKSVTLFHSFPDKMGHLESLKQKANELIKGGKYQIAIDMYSDLLNDCLGIITDGYKEHAELTKFKCVLYQNRALAFLKLKLPNECLEACKQCLEIDPRNEKCLYRKGEAYIILGDHEEAEKCFRQVILINDNNLEAKKKLKLCQDVISKALLREKKMFQGAFKRLANADSADISG